MSSMKMNVAQHLDLLWKFDRGLALQEAIFATVKPGDTVIDAGCGTGILSLWAAKAGALKVLAIDSEDTSTGEQLARENQVSDRIEFIQAELSDFEMPDNKRCDVLFGMLYFNDPRRDAAQAALTSRLRSRLLQAGGSQIPDRVVYTACALDWPQQDIGTRFSDIDMRISVMEQRYRLDLTSLRDAAKLQPHRGWFPARRSSGLVERSDARLLSTGKDTFTEIDYERGFEGYPELCTCRISQPGTCNVLLFTQALYAGHRLIFSNESVSWVRNPLRVEPDTEIRFSLDKAWFDTNLVTARIA